MWQLIGVVLFHLGTMCGAMPPSPPKSQAPDLLATARAAWTDYMVKAAYLHGVRVTSYVDDGIDAPMRDIVKSLRNARGIVVIRYRMASSEPSPTTEWTAHLLNEKYACELRRDSGDSPWVLQNIQMAPKPSTLASGGRTLLSLGARCTMEALPDAVALPGFQIVSLAPSTEQVPGMYLLKCMLSRDDVAPPRRIVATVVLDADHFWCVKACAFEESIGDKVYLSGQAENRYVKVDGIPQPRERRTEFTLTVGRSHNHHVWTDEYQLSVPSRLPLESDFTLSAFGLPEPFGVTWERPTPWWLYALISAGVLFVVAVIVSFWKRRLAARSAG